MPEFNNMTLVASTEMLDQWHSHSDLELLETEWNIHGRCDHSSKAKALADLAGVAINEDPEVVTVRGRLPLSRALVEKAANTPEEKRHGTSWSKLIAGLRMDGYEITENTVEKDGLFGKVQHHVSFELRRMLPKDIHELDFREAESELSTLLDRYDFATAKGHLAQAISNFSLGNWAGANAQFRSFYEGYLKEISEKLGYVAKGDHRARVRFLGELDPPFLLSGYNEWNNNDNKQQFIHGLMARMHPEGSHPGLSEEEDCTFRFQISLITARLLLRRFALRVSA